MILCFDKKTIVLFTMLFTTFLISQTKKEREWRIKSSDFPEQAIDVVKSLSKKCKRLKFYKEVDGDKESFELKFKYKRNHYSLEFSKGGIIEDIEVITKLRHVDDAIKENLEDYFEQNYIRYSIIKIQEQFLYPSSSKPSEFLQTILSEDNSLKPNFEIIAEVKTEDNREIREFTFNGTGKFVKSRKLSPTSYEHVLY